MRIKHNNLDDATSMRINKEEWEKIKADGDQVFDNRKIGYFSIAQGKLIFGIISPYFKDLKGLDEQDEEFTEEQKVVNKSVKEEIEKKLKGEK